MAGTSRGDYPLLVESERTFNELFRQWYAGHSSQAVQLEVLEGLRHWRRRALEIYFPTADEEEDSAAGEDADASSI